jgi:hypothetical protein
MLFRLLFVAGFLISCCAPSIAQGRDTNISARYLLRGVWAEPGKPDMTIEHEFSITLRPDGVTQQHQFGGVAGPSSPTRQLALGRDTQSNVKYRVVNANTIARVLENNTFSSTLTIKVAGNTCRLSYRAAKKPGHEFIVAVGYRGGPAGRFRSLRMVGQHCEIK